MGHLNGHRLKSHEHGAFGCRVSTPHEHGVFGCQRFIKHIRTQRDYYIRALNLKTCRTKVGGGGFGSKTMSDGNGGGVKMKSKWHYLKMLFGIFSHAHIFTKI